MKKITLILAFYFPLALQSAAQQPQLVVQSFEYIWYKSPDEGINGGKHWLDMEEADSIRHRIRKSFSNALYQRWNIVMPEISLSVKPLSIFSGGTPKFNAKLKDKQPGTWYMFFQAFSKDNSWGDFYDDSDNVTLTLRLKCRIIEGGTDSLILNRDLTVTLYSEPSPPDQVVLNKLPAHPLAFAKSFDSIATWLFSPEMENNKNIRLNPACVFSESGFNNGPLATLEFSSDNTSIQLRTQPSFFINKLPPTYTLIKEKKNVGGNTATGALSVLTNGSVALDKQKTKIYKVDYPFETDEDSLHCTVGYAEIISAEREKVKETGMDGKTYSHVKLKDYSVAYRHTDSSFVNSITLGPDTMAIFTITYLSENQRNSYTQMWDGRDSATIMPLPRHWKNNGETANVFVSGNLKGEPFLMQSSKERTIKNFFVGNQLALSIYGKNRPSKALLFQQLSPFQVKIFTILSSLPYDYYH